GAEFAQGVVFAGGLGELVVQFGQVFDLDAVHGDRDLGLLPLVLPAGELGGERGGVPGGHAGERGVQPVEQAGVVDLVGGAAGLGVVHQLPVDGGRQVDGHVVPVRGGAVHRLQGREAFAQVAQVLLDLVRAHQGVIDRH